MPIIKSPGKVTPEDAMSAGTPGTPGNGRSTNLLSLLLTIGLLIFIGVSCYRATRSTTTVTRLDHVTRVFMHDPSWYTFQTRDPAQGDTVAVRGYGRYTDVTLLADVPDDQPMWVEVTRRGSDFTGQRYTLVIHLHSGQDVDGAGWDYGKGGHGTTVVVGK